MYDEFLAYLRDNDAEYESVFQCYYNEKAEEEGIDMQGDDRYYGEDGYDYDPIELYEDFSHCTGNSALYHGAYGVIATIRDELGDDRIDPEDQELQEMVLEFFEQSV